jgi:hypothetical protein
VIPDDVGRCAMLQPPRCQHCATRGCKRRLAVVVVGRVMATLCPDACGKAWSGGLVVLCYSTRTYGGTHLRIAVLRTPPLPAARCAL